MEQAKPDSIEIILLDAASIIRGRIINSITVLERMIDIYLARHFAGTPTQLTELRECVFSTRHITFESKRIIFNHLTDTYNKTAKDTYLKGIHAKLDVFNKHRNAMAHYVIDPTKESVNHFKETQEVVFYKFEKSTEREYYSLDKSAKISEEISEFIEKIATLLDVKLTP
jgi:hypothetical protein